MPNTGDNMNSRPVSACSIMFLRKYLDFRLPASLQGSDYIFNQKLRESGR